MNQYMFTKTQQVEVFKPSLPFFVLGSVISVLYHSNMQTPLSQMTSSALNIGSAPLALTVSLHVGMLAILFSLVFASYGEDLLSTKAKSFAISTLSVSFGGVLAWKLISINSASPATILLALIMYLSLALKFWVAPNVIHHYTKKLGFHMNGTKHIILFFTLLATVLAYGDILKSSFT